MKVFAIVWIVVGAALVVAAAFFLLTHAAGPASTTLIATLGCIGVPFLGFRIWGLYTEPTPYHYERRSPRSDPWLGLRPADLLCLLLAEATVVGVRNKDRRISRQ